MLRHDPLDIHAGQLFHAGSQDGVGRHVALMKGVHLRKITVVGKQCPIAVHAAEQVAAEQGSALAVIGHDRARRVQIGAVNEIKHAAALQADSVVAVVDRVKIGSDPVVADQADASAVSGDAQVWAADDIFDPRQVAAGIRILVRGDNQ